MDPLLIGVLVAAPLLALPLLWCAVCLLLSRLGGWHRLARQYATQRQPSGRGFAMQSGWIGIVSYRNCLTVHVAPEGLFLSVMALLSIGHPRLLIPWSAIHEREPRKHLWRTTTRFEVGQPTLARIELAPEILEAAPRQTRA